MLQRIIKKLIMQRIDTRLGLDSAIFIIDAPPNTF